MKRRDLSLAASAAIVASMLAGGIAWAAIPEGGVIQGCYHKNNGQLRVVDTASQCGPSELALGWNQQGQQGIAGQNGTSPTVAALAAGDANCPAGGAAITDAAGSPAYVCSGEDGADGQAFSGMFTSPNGQYSISVTDAGISIAQGASNSINLTGDDLEIRSDDITVRSDQSTTVRAGTTATLDAAGNLTLRAGITATLDAAVNLALRSAGTALLRATGTLNLQGSTITQN